MKKNFLISTGGSGGHIVPATAMYEHLSKKNNVILTTDKRGLRYLDKDLYPFEIIDTPKLNNIFFLPFNFILVFILIIKSFYLLKIKNIEKIFSTGGYMSLPLIIAAKFLRLDIYLIEPNHVLGRANKYFLNSCKRIFCYTEEIKNFPKKFMNKMTIINPLINESFYKFNQSFSNKDKFTLLIVGGSQGAHIFDKNLKDLIVSISKKIDMKVIQQTNKENISNLQSFYDKNEIENKVFNFDKNFVEIINQADICLTRAGASTLAELSFLNVPFIAIPLPTSKDNHQFENANFYLKNDCCWLIEQKQFENKIEGLLEEIVNNKNIYLKKKDNLKKLNYQNTWINVNQKIIRSINEN